MHEPLEYTVGASETRETVRQHSAGQEGLLWMTGYRATLIPAWMYCNVVVFSTR